MAFQIKLNVNQFIPDNCQQSFLEVRNKAATGDFFRSYLLQKANVEGHLMVNGNFIFHMNGTHRRRLVLTDNSGQQLRSGFLGKTKFWRDPLRWHNNSDFKIKNFTVDKTG